MKAQRHTTSHHQRELEKQAARFLLFGLLAWLFKKTLLMICLRTIRI